MNIIYLSAKNIRAFAKHFHLTLVYMYKQQMYIQLNILKTYGDQSNNKMGY
jgi:hypothetical protein